MPIVESIIIEANIVNAIILNQRRKTLRRRIARYEKCEYHYCLIAKLDVLLKRLISRNYRLFARRIVSKRVFSTWEGIVTLYVYKIFIITVDLRIRVTSMLPTTPL